jgi:hypothetical protein
VLTSVDQLWGPPYNPAHSGTVNTRHEQPFPNL